MINDKTQSYYQLSLPEYVMARRFAATLMYKEVEEVDDEVWSVEDDKGETILTREVSLFGDGVMRYYGYKSFYDDFLVTKPNSEEMPNSVNGERPSLDDLFYQELMKAMENFEKRMKDFEERLRKAEENE